jgi:hypothetical protein
MLTRRSGRLLVALMLTLVASLGLTLPSASADTIIPIHWTVNASTHIKSLNMDVVVPPGSFDGEVNLTTGALTGNLTLPPATQKISILGIPLASATFAVQPTAPISGHVDLLAGTVSVSASFNFLITKASVSLLPRLNLVGNNCHGATPITQNFTGPVNLSGASTFSSEFTIPKFANCGLLTPILNLIIPGGGNTFTVTFAPPA